MQLKALVLGGAGFLGSHITEAFLRHGFDVTVVDGLMPRTGGRKENLKECLSAIELMVGDVDQVQGLEQSAESADVIVDCMGWTLHAEAQADPTYDLELNVGSHTAFLARAAKRIAGHAILLGSRGQFGKQKQLQIHEDACFHPVDVQGVHKVAAEDTFRLYSQRYGFPCSSLRLPNCFGPRQKTEGKELGTLGDLLSAAADSRDYAVYYPDRPKQVAYCADVAEDVVRLAMSDAKGFEGLNYPGMTVSMRQIGDTLNAICGYSCWYEQDVSSPHIDVGEATMVGDKLAATIKGWSTTTLSTALSETLTYFESRRQSIDLAV